MSKMMRFSVIFLLWISTQTSGLPAGIADMKIRSQYASDGLTGGASGGSSGDTSRLLPTSAVPSSRSVDGAPTSAAVPPTQAPTHVVETAKTTPNCITVRWQVGRDWNVRNFELKYQKVGDAFWGSIVDKTAPPGRQSYDVCNLDPSTSYAICVVLYGTQQGALLNASCVRAETADQLSNTYIRSSIGAVACVIFIMAGIVLVRWCTYKRQQQRLLKSRRSSRSSSAHGSFRERTSTMGSARSPRHSPRLGHGEMLAGGGCEQCELGCAECKLNAVAELETRRASLAVAYPGYLHPSAGYTDLSPMLKRYHSLQVKRPEERPRPGRGRSGGDGLPGVSPRGSRRSDGRPPRRMSRAQEIGLTVFPPPKMPGTSSAPRARSGAIARSHENVSSRRRGSDQLDVITPLPRRSAGSYRERRTAADVDQLQRRPGGSFRARRTDNASLPNGACEVEVVEPPLFGRTLAAVAPPGGQVEMTYLRPDYGTRKPEEIHYADSEEEEEGRNHVPSILCETASAIYRRSEN